MPEFYSSLRSFVRYKTFALQYIEVFDAVAEHFGLTGRVDESILQKAHQVFCNSLDAIRSETTHSKRAIFNAAGVSLVNATARAAFFMPKTAARRKLTTFDVPTMQTNLIGLYVHILSEYSDELIALLFGASMYLLESRLRNGKDPNCRISLPHAIAVARTLRIEPIARKQFLRSIKRPSSKGRA
jgi:hypothetical protein